jgi:diguanylate cyclase (GGDEF)-like protein
MFETEGEVLQDWRNRQFNLVNKTVMAALAVITLITLFSVGPSAVCQLLALELGVICLAHYLGARGLLDAAVALLVGSLTMMVSASTWMVGSVLDVELLAYPTILVISTLLLRLPSYICVVVYMLGAITVVAWAEMHGIIVSPNLRPVVLADVFDIIAILLASAVTSWILSNDLRRALARVSVEIVKQRASHKKIEFLANHDMLTGLPNRNFAMGRIEQTLVSASRLEHRTALLFLDLDNFKTINDSLGHDGGDELLRQVARRLAACIRRADSVSRHGGDEFLIMLTDVGTSQAAASVAAKITEVLSEPFQILGREVSTSTSIGVAMFPEDGETLDVLIRCADSAMYQAKEEGRNTYRFYTSQMNTDYLETLQIKNDMRLGLERNEFVLHYQPQVSLLDGKVIGAEALVRWNHPQKGLLGPATFIGIAEISGMIAPLGQWILREACSQAMAWQAEGLPPIVMAVNLSAIQFKRDRLEHRIENILRVTGLAPTLLELELTESVIIKDSEDVLQTIHRLKGLGVQIAIDDFGTGYSSLAYLRKFAIDKIKIDQSFVRDLENNPDSSAIVRAIIDMAQNLALKTIAEGVEDSATLDILGEFGCDVAQGYHLARPMPAAQFSVYLQDKNSSAMVA